MYRWHRQALEGWEFKQAVLACLSVAVHLAMIRGLSPMSLSPVLWLSVETGLKQVNFSQLSDGRNVQLPSDSTGSKPAAQMRKAVNSKSRCWCQGTSALAKPLSSWEKVLGFVNEASSVRARLSWLCARKCKTLSLILRSVCLCGTGLLWYRWVTTEQPGSGEGFSKRAAIEFGRDCLWTFFPWNSLSALLSLLLFPVLLRKVCHGNWVLYSFCSCSGVDVGVSTLRFSAWVLHQWSWDGDYFCLVTVWF